MMRLWLQSRAVRATAAVAGVISVAFHVATISAWVLATLPQEGVEQGSIANHVFYIPPPDRVPTRGGSQERVTYIKLAEQSFGTGDGPRMMGEARPVTSDETAGRDTTGKDSVVTHEAPVASGPDSVYSVLDVDTAVVRSASSAAPAYPLKLLEQHIQGYVNAQYVVDTTGFADTTTFVVLQSTNQEFIAAVRDALPYMRFQPAKIGRTRVRQLVQQQFSFRIADTATALPKVKKP
ncbi:MAG TPA: energy transducer TonB [Gemmatimonadaceae bacterium]|jgi:protein TonB|nr:energy transducer TonB [Gemmatimonadaceae bacterium]